MAFIPTDPVQRRLLAGTVALLLLLVLTALTFVARHALDGWMTPLGLVAPLDLLAVAVSMGAGGVIARHGFRGWAVALVVIAGLAGAMAAYGTAPPAMAHAGRWMLRNTALQLLLSAAVAWAAAHAGQRWALRRPPAA
ncbi:hypothetical protein [Cognatilysobacter segetis]|uniref:hypothetical protein n=1 Tax=Cognatilysobacter segetis TaxID=2492394 RepID=UPI00105DE496|nr:hypothetical protein [Lysobacter segetis]